MQYFHCFPLFITDTITNAINKLTKHINQFVSLLNFSSMKKYIFPLLALLAMPLVFTACSDDDDNAPRLPQPIETGEIPAKNVFIFVDGKYIAHGSGEKTQIEGKFNPATLTQNTVKFSCSSLFLTDLGSNGLFTSVPVFDLNLRKDNNEILMAGEYSDSHYKYNVTGEIKLNGRGENEWFIRVNRQLIPANTPITGKTYEIEFNSDDIYPNITLVNGTEDLGGMCTDFFRGMVDVLKENSGYSGAKIHFTDQWTYDLWFKNSETGEYEKDESSHRYFCGLNDVAFVDEPAFKEAQSKFFNLEKMDIAAEALKSNFAQQEVSVDMSDPSKKELVTVFSHRINDDNEFVLSYNQYILSFLSNWPTPDPLTTLAEKNFALIQSESKTAMLVYSPIAVFHPAD